MREYLIAIVCFILLGAVLEILMPDGQMKKYLKPVLGMIMVVTIVKSLWQISFSDSFWKELNVTEQESTYTETVYETNVVRQFEEKLADKITSVLQKNGVTATEVTAAATYEKGELVLSRVSLTADREEAYVTAILYRELTIEPSIVSVKTKGE